MQHHLSILTFTTILLVDLITSSKLPHATSADHTSSIPHRHLISLALPSTHARFRRSLTPGSEALSEASRKLRQVINANGGYNTVNTDLQAAYNVMYSEEVQNDPVLSGAIKFNEKGHRCEVQLCRETGQTQISMGACTMHFCHCASNRAFLKSCGPGTVYDAFMQICNWPENVDYCS